ncbi:MAG TPA: LysM peptidoglycan-binding domain-containing protein [Cytophagaceae bacterium]
MLRIFQILLLLSFNFTGFAHSFRDSVGVIKLNGKIHIQYLISPGETVYGISTKHGVAVSDLLEINPALENGLKVGQVINIPYNVEAINQSKAKDDSKVYHKVQPGETLYSLSKKYNVPLNDLLKLNNMEIKAGQQIVIADKTFATPSPTVKTVEPAVTVAKQPEPKQIVEDRPVAVVAKTTPSVAKVEEKKVNPAVALAIEKPYDFDPTMKQVLIIPFDPYLYFSDADDEIAAKSNIPRNKVRQVFRRRMNALIDHPAYENIHLLGGQIKDSISDLNKIYASVTYNYQEILENPYYHPPQDLINGSKSKGNKNWLAKQKDKLIPDEASKKAKEKETGKYFGVIIKNPDFFNYFNAKYNTDYYVFINQFEVKTNYDNCLDRAALNYERTFTTHFSIFDNKGKQVAGNQFKTHYNSNSCNVYQIVGDNMKKIADRVVAEIPVGQANEVAK